MLPSPKSQAYEYPSLVGIELLIKLIELLVQLYDGKVNATPGIVMLSACGTTQPLASDRVMVYVPPGKGAVFIYVRKARSKGYGFDP